MDTTAPHPTPPPALDPTMSAPSPSPAPELDDSRPFGAHLRMSWWKPLVIIPVLLIAMFVLQFAFTLVAILVETAAFGRDPMDLTISPLMMVAVNLSLAAMGPLAVLLTALIARVPWRSLLASPRRISMRRWGVYTGTFALLVLAMLGISALIAPEMVGLQGFAITGTTIGLVLVALLTTPLRQQARR